MVSPEERLTGTQALAHPWIANLPQQGDGPGLLPVVQSKVVQSNRMNPNVSRRASLAGTNHASRIEGLKKRMSARRASIDPMVMHNGVNIMDETMIASLQEACISAPTTGFSEGCESEGEPLPMPPVNLGRGPVSRHTSRASVYELNHKLDPPTDEDVMSVPE